MNFNVIFVIGLMLALGYFLYYEMTDYFFEILNLDSYYLKDVWWHRKTKEAETRRSYQF